MIGEETVPETRRSMKVVSRMRRPFHSSLSPVSPLKSSILVKMKGVPRVKSSHPIRLEPDLGIKSSSGRVHFFCPFCPYSEIEEEEGEEGGSSMFSVHLKQHVLLPEESADGGGKSRGKQPKTKSKRRTASSDVNRRTTWISSFSSYQRQLKSSPVRISRSCGSYDCTVCEKIAQIYNVATVPAPRFYLNVHFHSHLRAHLQYSSYFCKICAEPGNTDWLQSSVRIRSPDGSGKRVKYDLKTSDKPAHKSRIYYKYRSSVIQHIKLHHLKPKPSKTRPSKQTFIPYKLIGQDTIEPLEQLVQKTIIQHSAKLRVIRADLKRGKKRKYNITRSRMTSGSLRPYLKIPDEDWEIISSVIFKDKENTGAKKPKYDAVDIPCSQARVPCKHEPLIESSPASHKYSLRSSGIEENSKEAGKGFYWNLLNPQYKRKKNSLSASKRVAFEGAKGSKKRNGVVESIQWPHDKKKTFLEMCGCKEASTSPCPSDILADLMVPDELETFAAEMFPDIWGPNNRLAELTHAHVESFLDGI